MAETRAVKTLLTQLKAAYEQKSPDVSKCKKLLSSIKIKLINFQLIPPFTGDAETVKEQLLLARETLEIATYLSVTAGDESSFERHVNQVKPYYLDYGHLLPGSKCQGPITGLHLMFLLAHNRIADFHSEMELIPVSERSANPYVAYPSRLEQFLMEGSYNKVLLAEKDAPLPLFTFFVGILLVTVRGKIADCTEKAYENFPVSQASSMFMLKNQAEVDAFCKERGWEVKDSLITFGTRKKELQDLPSHSLIAQSLMYATELERIV